MTVYIDEYGRIVIVGFEAWNSASFVDENRAIPDKWKKLIPAEDTYDNGPDRTKPKDGR